MGFLGADAGYSGGYGKIPLGGVEKGN